MYNKGLLHRTGSYTQHPVINHNGKEYEKECVYMYILLHMCIYIYIFQKIYIFSEYIYSETNTELTRN